MQRLPEHIAIVMTGCARWAAARGETPAAGYQAAARTARLVARLARQSGLRYLTLCCPPPREAPAGRLDPALAAAFEQALRDAGDELRGLGIRVHGPGELDDLPGGLARSLEAAIAATAGHHGMHLSLTLAPAYGGRRDLVQAARHLATLVATGALLPEQIDQDLLRQTLWTAALPDPDLIVRTGGEQQLSDVLTYESAYAELYFSDALWPDFDAAEWQRALIDYSRRERRFGKTSEQLQSASSSGQWPAALASSI